MNRIANEFFTGINYWNSKEAINMWENFDIESIENDFKALKNVGITHLRVFPLWPVFQPLKGLYGPVEIFELGLGEDPLPDTPAGKAGVSEEACEKFEKFCNLADKYNLKLIVSLITGHMSFRTYVPSAFEGKSILSDPTVMKWLRKFIKYFVERFKSQNSIVGWDLGNEVNNLPGLLDRKDSFYLWCSAMADAIRSVDSSKPVISGIDNSSVSAAASNLKDAGEIFDIHTTHPYHIFSTNNEPICSMKSILDLPFRCRISEDISGIPTFVQEFGSIGYTVCSEKTEADFYRACLLTSLAHGFHGTMWWCAFDQGEFDYAPYRWNTNGNDYGFFDRYYNPKPITEENKKFLESLNKIPNKKLPEHKKEACVIIPRENKPNISTLNEIMRSTYILAKQANFDVNFSYALDKIPESKLYILTGLTSSHFITKQRFEELMNKVYNGSVLYISLDESRLPQLPKITGVEIGYKNLINKEITLTINGEKLPIFSKYFYYPESSKAQSVACCDEGDTVFFKYPYGKGFVYFLTLPLEHHLSNMNGAFYNDNVPPYHLIYRELAKTAGITRLCDSDNPQIRLTEHQINENKAYVFAINYSKKADKTNLRIADGYKITETIFGNSPKDNILELNKNDGALFVVEKI